VPVTLGGKLAKVFMTTARSHFAFHIAHFKFYISELSFIHGEEILELLFINVGTELTMLNEKCKMRNDK